MTLWFGTGSPCLLTLVLPWDNTKEALQMVYQKNEYPLIWSWQCVLAGLEFPSLSKGALALLSSEPLLALQVYYFKKRATGVLCQGDGAS